MLTTFISWATKVTGHQTALISQVLLQITIMIILGVVGTLTIIVIYNRNVFGKNFRKGDLTRLIKSGMAFLSYGLLLIFGFIAIHIGHAHTTL